MRITESQLRKVIREVIEETAHLNDRGMSRKDMHNMRPDLFDRDGNKTRLSKSSIAVSADFGGTRT